jgi:CBS domain-containing protein
MSNRRSARPMPCIDSVMTPFPYAIDLDRHVGDAQRVLAGRFIHHLPVTNQGEVFSVLSARDLELALARPDADPWQIEIRDVCSKDPYIVDVSEPLDVVLSQMAARDIGCAVVAKDDRVAGIFTAVDACRHFAEWLRKERHTEPPATQRDTL